MGVNLVNIRSFTWDDISSVNMLMARLCKDTDSPFDETRFKKSVKKRIRDPKSMLFVAEVDDHLIGMVHAFIEKNHTGIINNFFVLSRYRKQGVGGKLLDYAEAFFKRHKINKIIFKARRGRRIFNIMRNRGYKEQYVVMMKD